MGNGIVLDQRRTRPAKVLRLKRGSESTLLEITLMEGRNRQIRRVAAFSAIPFLICSVLKLLVLRSDRCRRGLPHSLPTGMDARLNLRHNDAMAPKLVLPWQRLKPVNSLNIPSLISTISKSLVVDQVTSLGAVDAELAVETRIATPVIESLERAIESLA